ncbi:3-methyl-2-oxobutanoate hydroxymethyltransferase [Radiobacillus kanasensis]|uniref:3-methyl-2-oxobutanoate hydroxymethyltransferase n=1 Tax=Radiobacillus kanasensis TaxID=2844358 RepID=UPI001E595256|nr:3-methyl-2-oxobutanoate hydroxymethyltransferase [Radiobacillus kanasensis]UFU01283.1 3-methyl-2-oxobutanoate hydroxymethyltransferase [Radiobacillus kanasensis]
MKTNLQLQKMKQENEKITMITAYDYPSALTAQEASVDMVLVGDSLGMVVLGYDSTVQVTVDDMIHHGKAVTRAATDTFVVVDMPFMSYHISMEDSLLNARRIFQQTNAQALKLEGASEEVLALTKKLTDAGIPVVSHIGLTPQSVHVLGGFKVQGKDKQAAEKLLRDAQQLEAHGAMAIVLECVPKQLASVITSHVKIPTIGIGAGPDCDGQVLVYHDLVQYGVSRLPKFVKAYEDISSPIRTAIESYIKEVKQQTFPSEDHSYTMNEELLKDL